MADNYVLGIGAANYDIHVKTPRKYNLNDSNPAQFEGSTGGVCRNILENLSRLGVNCKIITAVGADAFASGVLQSLESVGIGTEGVYKDSTLATSSYIDFVDGKGDMFVAACDARVLEGMPLSWIMEHEPLITGADAIIVDANLTKEQLELIVDIAGNVPILADPVSIAKSERLKTILSKLYIIKPNVLELEALSGMNCDTNEDIEEAASKLLDQGCYAVVTSLGDKGCCYMDGCGAMFAPPKKVVAMENCTGAGDAFMAGLAYGIFKKCSINECIDIAQVMGCVAVESSSTISPLVSEEYILSLVNE